MKRIVVILLLLALLACVPTPEEESVKNKANGTLEEMIRAESSAPDEKALCTRSSARRNICNGDRNARRSVLKPDGIGGRCCGAAERERDPRL